MGLYTPQNPHAVSRETKNNWEEASCLLERQGELKVTDTSPVQAPLPGPAWPGVACLNPCEGRATLTAQRQVPLPRHVLCFDLGLATTIQQKRGKKKRFDAEWRGGGVGGL